MIFARRRIPVLCAGLTATAHLAAAQQIDYGVCQITAAGAVTSLGGVSACPTLGSPPNSVVYGGGGGGTAASVVTVIVSANPAMCTANTTTVTVPLSTTNQAAYTATSGFNVSGPGASAGLNSAPAVNATMAPPITVTTTEYKTTTVNATVPLSNHANFPQSQPTQLTSSACTPTSTTRTPISTVSSTTIPTPVNPAPSAVYGDNLMHMLWRQLPDVIDLTDNARGSEGAGHDTAFAAAAAAIIKVNPDHIPSVLFQYVRRKDYTWGNWGLEEWITAPNQNAVTDDHVVMDDGTLWRKAKINSDGSIGVGMYGPAPNDDVKHPWQAARNAKLPAAVWADAWYGRLWISVLQQNFKAIWGHGNVVRTDDGSWDAIQKYRTDWLAALTGLHGRVFAYGKDDMGLWLYQAKLMRCDSVPMIIVTDSSAGDLPKNADLTVNTVIKPPADATYALDTMFELYNPFARTKITASLHAIVAQTRAIITVDDSVIAIREAPPKDACSQFRDGKC